MAAIEHAVKLAQRIRGRRRARAEHEGGELLSRECEVRRCRGVRIRNHKHAVAQFERLDARFAFDSERERLA